MIANQLECLVTATHERLLVVTATKQRILEYLFRIATQLVRTVTATLGDWMLHN